MKQNCFFLLVWDRLFTLHPLSPLPQGSTAPARCCCPPSRIRWCPTWTWAVSRAPSCSSSTSCTAAGSGGTAPSSPTSSWRLWRASSRRPSTPTSGLASSWPARSICGRRKWRWVRLLRCFLPLLVLGVLFSIESQNFRKSQIFLRLLLNTTVTDENDSKNFMSDCAATEWNKCKQDNYYFYYYYSHRHNYFYYHCYYRFYYHWCYVLLLLLLFYCYYYR